MFSFFFKTLLFLLVIAQIDATQTNKMKILVLIVASDDQPVYLELQKTWRAYMHLDPEHVEAYFIKADPNLRTECEIKGDVIWAKTETSLNPGMINKTILAMEYMVPRLKEFDYVIRTNLSSFYVFPRIFKFLKTLPRTECFCAQICQRIPGVIHACGLPQQIGFEGIIWAQGAGVIFSPDFIELIVQNKSRFWNQGVPGEMFTNEDVVLSAFFQQNRIPIIPAPRFEILTVADWHQNKNTIPKDAFHFRVKNPQDGSRQTEDIYIHKQLLKMFYNVTLE